MSHSLQNADRRTHVKILVVGLVCAAVVTAVGAFARVSDIDLGTEPLVKAGHSTSVTGQLPAIR